jgi:hypothetical protein
VKPPQLKKLTFFDLFIFAAVFFSVFFASLNQRSMAFNVCISVVLLGKVFVGMCFFRRQSWRSLRVYYIIRLAIDAFIYAPLLFIFRVLTATYTINYFLAAGILFISELIVIIIYRKDLIRKNVVEKLEEVNGTKVS